MTDDLRGTGTSRSADDELQERGAVGDRDAEIDPAVGVQATTDSHPAEPDELDVNRSGSGGSGPDHSSEPEQ